jgi:hypothetical protein
MNPEEKSTIFLHNRLKDLQEDVPKLFPLMRGCVVSIGMKKKKPTYSLNIKGKTRIVSLGKGKDTIALKYIDNHNKLLKIVEEMTLINIELIRRFSKNDGSIIQ